MAVGPKVMLVGARSALHKTVGIVMLPILVPVLPKMAVWSPAAAVVAAAGGDELEQRLHIQHRT